MKEINLEKHKTLSDRYAKALLRIAQENSQEEQVAKELRNIVDVFSQNPNIADFFTNPIISKDDKKEILEKSFKNNVNDNLYKFLNVLIDKNRMFILANIENLYHKKLIEKDNILEVEAQSVIVLDDNMQELLKTKLNNITGKTIVLSNTINPEIIGGVVLLFNGKVIDGSVKTQLQNLQKQLI